MRLEDVRIGMKVVIVKDRESPRYWKTGTVLSIYDDYTGSLLRIRIVLEDGSGEIVGNLQPEDLDFE